MRARRSSASLCRPNSSTITSKVQSSPRWLQKIALDVEGRRTKPVRDIRDLGGRDEKEDGGRIDEAADEPRTGDAVDLRPRACDPDGAPLLVRFRHMIRTHQQAFAFDPGFEAAFEVFGARAGVAQPGGDALAQFLSALTDHDDGSAGVFVGPG